MDNAAIVEGQFAAYNEQDVDTFCSFFTDDIVGGELNGVPGITGIEDLRLKYAAMFARYPLNRVTLLNRIAVGRYVIDHEDCLREPGGERIILAAIYTMRDGKIARLDMAKAG